jgi:Calpain family cysteine protease
MTSDSRGHVRIRSIRSDGRISGRARPDTVIEAVNLSRVAASRLCLDDTVVLATADSRGAFAGRIACFGGDAVRLRGRGRGGATSPWLTIQIPAGGASRRPEVALYRIGFRPLGNGQYLLVNIGRPRPISQPGALLSFKNLRTSMPCRIVLDANGSFARHQKVAARPGDRVLVGISQSGNHRIGTVTVPSANDQMMNAARLARLVSGHSHTLFDVKRIRGPLLIGRPRACDVVQGEVANCHLAGAVSAVAHACGGHIKKLIRRVDREHFSVSLFSYDKAAKRWLPGSVVVSDRFYVRASGAMLFGSGSHPGGSAGRPAAALWWPMLEKAYAQLYGGYAHFETGGTPHHALSVLLGRPPRHWEIRPQLADRLWNEARERLGTRLPVVLSTAGNASRLLYRNTGIMTDHCYAVLGCFVTRDRRMVVLRNPWGEVIPPGSPASRDGSFSMPWETAIRLFAIMSSVEPVR